MPIMQFATKVFCSIALLSLVLFAAPVLTPAFAGGQGGNNHGESHDNDHHDNDHEYNDHGHNNDHDNDHHDNDHDDHDHGHDNDHHDNDHHDDDEESGTPPSDGGEQGTTTPPIVIPPAPTSTPTTTPEGGDSTTITNDTPPSDPRAGYGAYIWGSGGSGGGVVLGTSTEATSTPAATSTPTSCTGPFTKYMRLGMKDSEVEKLQQFLNEHGADIPVTGVFGPLTFKAVNEFQLAHSDEVLKPWVVHGLKDEHTTTGYVYKTTLRMLNKVACSTYDAPIPTLP